MTTPWQEGSWKEAMDWSRSVPRTPPWLCILGPGGSGKTTLAAALGNDLLDQGLRVVFVKTAMLLDTFRSAYKPGSEDDGDDVFERFARADVLILDNIGEEHTTPWANIKLFQVVDYRYDECLHTIFTTKCELDDIKPESVKQRIKDQAMTYNIRTDVDFD